MLRGARGFRSVRSVREQPVRPRWCHQPVSHDQSRTSDYVRCRLQHTHVKTYCTLWHSRAYFFDSRTIHDNSQARRDSREASFLSTPRQGWGRPPHILFSAVMSACAHGVQPHSRNTRGSTMPPTLPFEGASLVPLRANMQQRRHEHAHASCALCPVHMNTPPAGQWSIPILLPRDQLGFEGDGCTPRVGVSELVEMGT